MINRLLGQGCPLNYTKLPVISVIFLTSLSNDLLFRDSLDRDAFWEHSIQLLWSPKRTKNRAAQLSEMFQQDQEP